MLDRVLAAAQNSPIVDYEHDEDLAAALTAGFSDAGPILVWVR